MLKSWAILVVLASAPAAAPATAELAVEGNVAFGDAEIEAAAYRDGAVDGAAVERLYLRAGYLDARVELTVEEDVPPTLAITEGARYRVAALDVDNDSPLSRDEVAAFIPFGPGDAPSPPDLREGLIALLAKLADRGYLRAEAEYAVTDAGAARVDVAVAVRAGEKYAAGEIHLVGARRRDEEAIREKLETRPSKPLQERALARDLLTIIDYYRERGYPTASARPRAFEFAERYKEIDFAVIIEPGDKVTVTAIGIVGNRRTRDGVIRREILTVPGEPYDIERLRKSARRIYNLKYFEAEPDVELVDAEAGRLRVTVVERPTYRVTGALAYEPRQGETAAAVIGEMDARLANLFGTGRELDARYRRLAVESTDAAAAYYEPWIGGVDLFAQPSGLYKERVTYRRATGERRRLRPSVERKREPEVQSFHLGDVRQPGLLRQPAAGLASVRPRGTRRQGIPGRRLPGAGAAAGARRVALLAHDSQPGPRGARPRPGLRLAADESGRSFPAGRVRRPPRL
jgi:outer membrane protein assembly factor BamA